ncbi:MAG: hypothetical protein SCK29_08830 [Bacillota bacterium]|nr:hypothetical protein [Bacillota bacterium]MDW7684203.1 hypothetical protein [Bacillota bacterium]
MKRMNVMRRTICFPLVLVFIFVVSSTILFLYPRDLYTFTLYSSQAQSSSVYLSATEFSDNFTVRPGKSFAGIWSGLLSAPIDFGLWPAGNSKNFPEALVVENIDSTTNEVTFSFSDGLAQLFDIRDNDKLNINPYEKATVSLKLSLGSDLPEGEYSGELYISAKKGFLVKSIPVLIQIGKSNKTADSLKSTEQSTAKAPVETGNEDAQPDSVVEEVYESPSELSNSVELHSPDNASFGQVMEVEDATELPDLDENNDVSR